MTAMECAKELKRLAEAFSVPLQAGQYEAYHRQFAHVDVAVWRASVDDLLCRSRFPDDLNLVRRIVEEHAEHARKRQVETEKREAEQWREASGKTARTLLLSTAPHVPDPESLEMEYRIVRAMALKRAWSLANASGFSMKVYAGELARSLDVLLLCAEFNAWACTAVVRGCGKHDGNDQRHPHTLLSCVLDETVYWRRRADGMTEEAATAAIGG